MFAKKSIYISLFQEKKRIKLHYKKNLLFFIIVKIKRKILFILFSIKKNIMAYKIYK